MKGALIAFSALALFSHRAVAAGYLNDVQLDDVCSGRSGCCPSSFCNRDPFMIDVHLDLMSATDNGKNNLAGGAEHSAPTSYTLLTGQAATSVVLSLLGSK